MRSGDEARAQEVCEGVEVVVGEFGELMAERGEKLILAAIGAFGGGLGFAQRLLDAL